jgi:hypothetical protein
VGASPAKVAPVQTFQVFETWKVFLLGKFFRRATPGSARFKLFLEAGDGAGEVNFTPGDNPDVQFDLAVEGQPPS